MERNDVDVMLCEVAERLVEVQKQANRWIEQRDRYRAALLKIVEWCDGVRGPEDHERDVFEHIGDCAKHALAPKHKLGGLK